MKKQKIIILVVALILVAIFIIVSILSDSKKLPEEQQVSMGRPINVVLDFYTEWQEELKSSETNPYESGLSESPILSPELRKKIMNEKTNSENDLDPVLCQTTPDIDFVARVVYEKEDEVQIVITARDKALTGQSIVTVFKYNEGWFLNDIVCSPGEFGEEREFTFEREGSLLKGSLLNSFSDSFNPDLWYLIFEENGELGHNAPLIFDSESVCSDKNGEEIVCAPDQFIEATKVSIRGQMTEGGVNVDYLMFINE